MALTHVNSGTDVAKHELLDHEPLNAKQDLVEYTRNSKLN